MTMEGSRERRYFSAVAGDRRQQGELFGYANLFKMQRPGSNLTLDILKVNVHCLLEGVHRSIGTVSLARCVTVSCCMVCGFLQRADRLEAGVRMAAE